MTLFFPDVNVWLALSIADHCHTKTAWKWLDSVPGDGRLLFSRYTQLGVLQLLTSAAVTGKHPFTLREAWAAYDRWIQDPRVEFYPEPRNADSALREAMKPFETQPSSKAVGDCWLLAFAAGTGAALVTFDRALHDFARKCGQGAVMPR
ncbi:MAG: TA system VapC family ribonuclease toxin [Acidobacteriaceae bacterium]